MNQLNAQQIRAALTEREYDVLRLLTSGLSDREIAETLVLTVGTVKWYNRQIYNKLDVRNRVEATTRTEQLGLLKDATQISDERRPSVAEHHLPAQVTSFIGRRQEIGELREKLLESRLVTLTGPPGSGKTRLAVEVGTRVADRFGDGVYFVSLAPLGQPSLVVNSIAQTLGVKESGNEPLLATLQNTLRHKHLLLILDNFEHLLPAASLVSELLAGSPHLRILVTSREILRLYGEHEFPVPPLLLPNLKEQGSALSENMKRYEAVELFVQRAHAALPSFRLDDDNAVAVGTICVHLDGLPLAIELAAARIKFYAPQTLLLRLASRLEALTEGPRDLPARQRTLRATLTWSYDLLDQDEQILFARLGVFVGGFTLEDAQAICSSGLNLSVMEGLESLLNKSLVIQQQRSSDETRFVLLETMREYALEKLHEHGEKAFIFEQHAQYYLDITTQSADEIYGSHQMYWLNWLEAQHGNLRTALQWYLEKDDTRQQALSLSSNLARFWELKGYFNEGRGWLQRALELPNISSGKKVRADALFGIGAIAYLQGDYAATQSFYEDALAIYQQLGDRRNAAQTLISLGEVATEIGDYKTAPLLFQEAYAITRQLDDVVANARALTQLGFGALRVGSFDEAQTWLAEGATLYQEAKDQVGSALAASGLGEIAIRRGELDHATQLLEKSLLIRQELGHKWGIAVSLGSLAWVALRQGDFERAVNMLHESLLIRQEIGDRGGMAWCLEKLAAIAYHREEYTLATRIYGYAAFLRAGINSVIDPSDQGAYQEVVGDLRTELGNDRFEVEWVEGQVMTIEQVIRDSQR